MVRRNLLGILVCTGLLLVACGATGTESSTSITSDAQGGSARDPAPDFTLDLGDGGSYTLSEGSKPVYLVFWAEW